jgi:hypothetical protein
MELLRRLLSILLLAIFGLPAISPLFALSATNETGLPACCRRSGTHHCMNDLSGGDATSHDLRLGAPVEKCPYAPRAFTVVHPQPYTIATADAVYASLVSHPAVLAQTESKWRIARDRARQKRGPPSTSLI